MFGTSKEKSGASFVHVSEGPTECSIALTEKLDLLFEKRLTVREAALETINSTLAARVCSGCIEDRQERLADALQHILQRNVEEECLIALQCVSLSALSLQEGKVFYTEMENVINKIITDDTDAVTPTVRAAALDTLGIVCFMNSVDPEHTLEVSYTLSGIFYEEGGVSVPACVLAAAINAWTLILTTVDDGVIAGSLFAENIAVLNDHLSHSDLSVRTAAGKSLVVLVEALRNNERTTQELPEYESVSLYSLDTSSSLVTWDDVMDKLDSLSQEKFKAQGKVESKKQKKLFRTIASSIKEGYAPIERLTVRDVSVELDTWAQITQMDRIRGVLGEGFMQHMTQNNNMMNIFNYYVNPEPVADSGSQYTKKERRRSMIEAEKEYTRYIGAGRKVRAHDLAGFASE